MAWFVEDSRFPFGDRGNAPPEQIVVDPTVIFGMLCCTRFRPGIERMLKHAQLVSPSSLPGDMCSTLSGLSRIGLVPPIDSAAILKQYEQIPVRVVHIEAELILDLSRKLHVGVTTCQYIAAAIPHGTAIMSFDRRQIEAARRAGVSRIRYAGGGLEKASVRKWQQFAKPVRSDEWIP